MKKIIRIEEAAMFGLSIFLFNQTSFEWWWYLALILAPDIGMAGYIIGPKEGAFTYNLFHNKAIALLLFCVGIYILSEWLALAGIILFGHSCMDRMFNYGLKYPDNFKHTHLGWLNQH